jgi:MraZ protein
MATFRGNHPAKVDEKGRLKLPAAFKQLVDAEHVTQFYITSKNGESAEIWPLPEWEKQEQKFEEDESIALNDSVQRYITMTSYYGQQVEMDNQGRLLLPQILRGAAKLDAEVPVVVFGKLKYVEVCNREMFEANLPANTVTAEDRMAIAAILSRRS